VSSVCERCDGSGAVVSFQGRPLGCSWLEFRIRRAVLLELSHDQIVELGPRAYRKLRVELLRKRSRFGTVRCPDCDGSGASEVEVVTGEAREKIES